MDKAFVGYVDNQAVVCLMLVFVMDGTNRSQLSVILQGYIDEQSSTGCINEARITDLHPYYQHVGRVGKGVSTQFNHEFLEGLNSSVH
jgi:hypothetical protein